MYQMQQLTGLGEAPMQPTEDDLALFTFIGNTAYQKVGIADYLTNFAIQFAPKYHPTSDVNGQWERTPGANTMPPGTPGQSLWVWNPRTERPFPVAGTVLERDVAGRRLLIADGTGGSYWKDWNYPAAGTIISRSGTGSEYIEVVADGNGGNYMRGPGVSTSGSNALLWIGLAALLLLS